MGADAGMETSVDRRSLGTFCACRDLSYLCGGRPAHGDYFRDLLWAAAGNRCAARSLWSGADSVDLVLHRTDWLAGFGDSGHSHAKCHCSWMAAETAKRLAQFAICRRAHYFDLATATALSSRISTLFLRGSLHSGLDSDPARSLGADVGARSAAAGVFISALAQHPASSRPIPDRSSVDFIRGVDWLDPTGCVLFSHCDAG